MKRYIIISALLIISVTSILSQGYFLKSFVFEDSHNEPRQIYFYKGRLLSVVGHFCRCTECSSLVEFSMSGDTLWRRIVPDIDVAGESMLVSNDTITLTGNNDPVNTLFRMAHYTLSGEKLGETMEIEQSGQAYTDCYQLTTQRIADRYLIMGSCNLQDSSYSLLYVVDTAGRLDTLVEMSATDRYAIPWDSEVDTAGNLVTFHEMVYKGQDNKYRKIITYDQDLDTVWTYDTEKTYAHFTNAKGTVMKDGRILLKTYTSGANYVTHSIRAISSDKEEIEFYKPDKASSNARSFSRLKVLSNGDVLGMGSFQDLSLDPPVHRAPWLIRISPLGEVLWQRIFYELDERDNEARLGTIRDVAELPNGDLYGVGALWYDFATSMVFKVSGDGCLDPDDCGTIQFLTEVKNPLPEGAITVYPNPVSESIKISNDTYREMSYMLIDHLGRTMIESTPLGTYTEVDVSEYASGIYHVIMLEDGQMVGHKKIVKR